MRLIPRLLLIAVIPLLFACVDSSGDNSDQQVPGPGGPPQTVIFCADCELVDVLGVIDGDTIDTSVGRIRFYGVDTPERGETCSVEAAEFTRSLVGDRIRIEDGPRLEDSFGRRLAYVYDASGNSIDVQLVSGGYATAWTRDGQHRDILIGLEESAKSNKAGCLWTKTGFEFETLNIPTDVDYLSAWGERVPWESLPTGWETSYAISVPVWIVDSIVENRIPVTDDYHALVISESPFEPSDAFTALQLVRSNTAEIESRASWLLEPSALEESSFICLLSERSAKLRFGFSWSFADANCNDWWARFLARENQSESWLEFLDRLIYGA